MDAFTSFDQDSAAGAVSPTVGGAIPLELPAELQREGTLWPTPADQVSDHSAEGAPWQAAARDVPQDPPQGALWQASHDGPSVPYSAQVALDPLTGADVAAAATGNHDGDGQALQLAAALPRMGKPFTVNQGGSTFRHLISQAWDALTGMRVNPGDAPSAPHELYGSQHGTRPRLVPASDQGPLFSWAWPAGNVFPTNDPGYYGVQAYPPDASPRPQGSVTAQLPSDPFTYQTQPGPAAAAPAGADPFDLGI